MRGLRVALVEKADVGGGTTAGSTRPMHGGLRYLETRDFALVRMDLRERETLLKVAPHLVRPLPLLVPSFGRAAFSRWRLRIGMVRTTCSRSTSACRSIAGSRATRSPPRSRG